MYEHTVISVHVRIRLPLSWLLHCGLGFRGGMGRELEAELVPSRGARAEEAIGEPGVGSGLFVKTKTTLACGKWELLLSMSSDLISSRQVPKMTRTCKRDGPSKSA